MVTYLLYVGVCQEEIWQIKKSEKFMKIDTFEGENLHIFWTTWGISMNFRYFKECQFSVKMWLLTKLKVTKTRVSLSFFLSLSFSPSLFLSLSLSLSLENTFLKKLQEGWKFSETWDFTEFEHAAQDSYVSEFFALSNNLFIHWKYFPKWLHIQRKLWGNLTRRT